MLHLHVFGIITVSSTAWSLYHYVESERIHVQREIVAKLDVCTIAEVILELCDEVAES